MPYAIETSNLSKTFDKNKAVSSLDLAIKPGEIFGLVGPDGAGKSTTMRMLCGIMNPTSGAAQVAGYNVIKNPEAVKEHIGYMSQKFSLYGELTVSENLEFFAELYGIEKGEYETRKKDLLAFSGLAPYESRVATNLSGGMKQKLALSCTLIHTPNILFLDEPTTGVDPVSRREFWRILNSLAGKVTIFVTTPYLDEAERCNRLALMHKGKIVLCDTPDAIKDYLKKEVIEVHCDDAHYIREYVGELQTKLDIKLFGDRLHVFSSDTKADLPIVLQQLKQIKCGYFSYRIVKPTLEDVFISLLEDKK
ncbi:MAG: ABC transporter ATP-binding protein [bacterium]